MQVLIRLEEWLKTNFGEQKKGRIDKEIEQLVALEYAEPKFQDSSIRLIDDILSYMEIRLKKVIEETMEITGSIYNWTVDFTPFEIDHVVISEIQLAGEDVYDEFIELYNPTDSDINLENYHNLE